MQHPACSRVKHNHEFEFPETRKSWASNCRFCFRPTSLWLHFRLRVGTPCTEPPTFDRRRANKTLGRRLGAVCSI
jgi:hypothetical protein